MPPLRSGPGPHQKKTAGWHFRSGENNSPVKAGLRAAVKKTYNYADGASDCFNMKNTDNNHGTDASLYLQGLISFERF
jgi:hypothetical protein